jgi:putative transposase
MRCPRCGSERIGERSERTAQGYRRFRCRACGKQLNERTGTALNRTQDPADVIALVVLWRLRYQLSLRDLAEMVLARGIVFGHEAVRTWEAELTPRLSEELRRKRRGRVGTSWYVDETYLRVGGRWCYLYRAVDRNGNLVDVMLSERRDLQAARAFFRSAKVVTGVVPARVTPTGMTAILLPSAASWGRRCGTGPAPTSTTVSSRTTAASRAGTGRCAASGRLPQPDGSAVAMMSCGPSCGPALAAESMSQRIAGG